MTRFLILLRNTEFLFCIGQQLLVSWIFSLPTGFYANHAWCLCVKLAFHWKYNNCLRNRGYDIPNVFVSGAVKALEFILDCFKDCDITTRDRNGKGILHKAVHQLQETYDVKNAGKKFAVHTFS